MPTFRLQWGPPPECEDREVGQVRQRRAKLLGAVGVEGAPPAEASLSPLVEELDPDCRCYQNYDAPQQAVAACRIRGPLAQLQSLTRKPLRLDKLLQVCRMSLATACVSLTVTTSGGGAAIWNLTSRVPCTHSRHRKPAVSFR